MVITITISRPDTAIDHTTAVDRIVLPTVRAVIMCHMPAGAEPMVVMMIHYHHMPPVPVE